MQDRLNTYRMEQFCHWIRERERIRILKESGQEPPWTTDIVLGHYHFCNVRREDDRVTREIRNVVLRHGVELMDLPRVYTFARLFNLPATLDMWLEWGEDWTPIKDRRMAGVPVFHTAYVVSTNGKKVDKIDYVKRIVEEVGGIGIPRGSCRSAFGTINEVEGMGSFLAGQVVADLKNDRYLSCANDWESFSVIGPGSRKGLSILFNRQIKVSEYDKLIQIVDLSLPEDIKAMDIHRQDLQNCLCEFSKYIRLLDGLPGRRRPYHARNIYPKCEFGIPTAEPNYEETADRRDP